MRPIPTRFLSPEEESRKSGRCFGVAKDQFHRFLVIDISSDMSELFGEPRDTTGIWRVGTAGWSYPPGSGSGTWTGVFYPLKKTDELKFYSRYFNTVEVNSTFYRPCSREVARGWVRRTPDEFEFTVKVWREFTHTRGSWSRSEIDLFREGLEPLAESGKLGCILFQFPASFHRSEENLAYLERVLSLFSKFPSVVELRHRSWNDSSDLITTMGATPAFIDEPKFATSIRQILRPSGVMLYVRLHGRRKDTWWTHENREERYDYLYSGEEIDRYAGVLKQLSQDRPIEKAYLIFNNHPGAKAVANAVTLRSKLEIPNPTPLPAPLLERFPELGA